MTSFSKVLEQIDVVGKCWLLDVIACILYFRFRAGFMLLLCVVRQCICRQYANSRRHIPLQLESS